MIAKEIRDFRAMSESRARVEKQNTNFSVAMRLGVTPVPIPNTMVKTQAADGTALETVWESRWLPNSIRKKPKCFYYIDTDIIKWSKENGLRKSHCVNPTSRAVLL